MKCLTVLLMILPVLAADDAGRSKSLKGAIRKADRLIERVNLPPECWLPPPELPAGGASSRKSDQDVWAQVMSDWDALQLTCGRQMAACRSTVDASRALDGPCKVTLTLATVERRADGTMLVNGTFRPRKVGPCIAPGDQETLATAKDAIETARRERMRRRDDEGLATAPALRENRRADERRYGQQQTQRREQLAQARREAYRSASGPKEYFEAVDVDVVIPPGLAKTIDLGKLATAKKATIVVKLITYEIREPAPEYNVPAAIGWLACRAVSIQKHFLKPDAADAASVEK